MNKLLPVLCLLGAALLAGCAATPPLRGSNDLGVVVERASGSLLVVEHSGNTVLSRLEGLGDLSHASVVFSRDGRYAYVFGRDGGLTKVDILAGATVARVVQSGNSIGGAISQDGRLVAVSNYEPGGVRIFDAGSLELLADIPATAMPGGKFSKVVGLADVPGQKFVFSLFDTDEIWLADVADPRAPALARFEGIGRAPYDALITADGRYYLAGLFGEDGLALLDLWHPEQGVHKILSGYGRGEQALPVYKMPHLEGFASAGDYLFVPAVGRHELLVIDRRSWQQVASIPVEGQVVFVRARPDGRQVWVNFAFPDYDRLQVIDVDALAPVKTLRPGKGVLHMEFTPRGDQLWVSVRDEDKLTIYDTVTLEPVKELPAEKPSGIFFTHRAGQIGL